MKRRNFVTGLLAALGAIVSWPAKSNVVRPVYVKPTIDVLPPVPTLSQESLERVLIAIMQLTDDAGRRIHILPKHILLPGVMRQYEQEAHAMCDTIRLRRDLTPCVERRNPTRFA